MRHVALISSCLLLWPSLCVGWPPLDDALASQGAKTNQLTQPVELEFTPRGDATNWVGGNSTRKAIVRAVNTETFGRAKVVKLDGEGINFWFEATYKEKLPPLPDVLKAKSIGALDKIFGKRTNWGDGYDAGGAHNKYYFFTVQPNETLLVFLVEIETAGWAKGQLRVWTASYKLSK